MANDVRFSDYVVEDEGSILKSPNDVRSYRSLVLPNGIRVILILDPQDDVGCNTCGSQADGTNTEGPNATSTEGSRSSASESGSESDGM